MVKIFDVTPPGQTAKTSIPSMTSSGRGKKLLTRRAIIIASSGNEIIYNRAPRANALGKRAIFLISGSEIVIPILNIIKARA